MGRVFRLIISIIIFYSLLLFACSLDTGDESVIVTLDTGLSKNVSRGPEPINISSITLTVTGRYMNEIRKAILPNTGIIILAVPAGRDRTFEIFAEVDPAGGSLIKSYKGSRTLNLIKPGTTVSISVQMNIFETKIIIPDTLNSRIIQIDGMAGTSAEIDSSWKSLKLSDLSSAGFISLQPYDVDIDSLGRICIAATYTKQDENTYSRVLRINDINDTVPFESFESLTQVTSVAVDRYNGLVYYADSTSVYRSDLDGASSSVFIEAVSSDGISGLAIDPSRNLLFISGTNNFQVFDLVTAGHLAIFEIKSISESGSEASDITANSSGIYGALSKFGDGGSNMIIQFAFDENTDTLSVVDTYNNGLYGPRRFLSTTNPGIYFIDETTPPVQVTLDKIIYMDDIDGTGRREYGQTGQDEPGYFHFFKQ